MIDTVGHISARLPHPGEPRHEQKPPASGVAKHRCTEAECRRCEARDAIRQGRDAFAEIEGKLMEVRELLHMASLIGPAEQDTLVPYLPSPITPADGKPASGALTDAAYHAIEAAQLLLFVARGTGHFGYLARASSHLAAASYGAARVTDRYALLDMMAGATGETDDCAP